jgi:protein-disulfide isomerase
VKLAAALLILGATVAVPADAATVRKATAATDWTRIVVKTPAGGYRMGNAKAKVTLVEYGSMTCPHCRAFDAEGGDALIRNYVKTGKVSYEFRNYVRDPYDVGAALIARCNGAKGFFALTRALFKDQPKWIEKAQSTPADRLEAMKNLPTNRLFLESAKLAGLPQWAAARGVPAAKSGQCLTNEKEIERLVAMNKAATDQYPDFPGTPTFILNGKMLEQAGTWGALEPKLRAELGG